MALSKGVGSTPGIKRGNDSDSGARLFVVLLAVSLILFTVSARQGETGPLVTLRNAFSTVTMPIRYAGALASAPFQGLGNVFGNLTASQESLSDLKKANEELTRRNAELEESAQMADRLRELLELKSGYNLQQTAARIISGSSDSWSRTVTIDKGTTSGIAVGMPVADGGGAIGQVISCGPTSATVRLTTDENSGVSAMIQSSRAQGMLHGSADGTLSLALVSTDKTVEVGDTVVTSGIGGIYPKGLPLGKVASVTKPDAAPYYEISVSSLSSLENLEEVLVITSLTEDQKASAEDIAEADKQEAASVADSETQSGTSTPEASQDKSSADASSSKAEAAQGEIDGASTSSDAKGQQQ